MVKKGPEENVKTLEIKKLPLDTTQAQLDKLQQDLE